MKFTKIVCKYTNPRHLLEPYVVRNRHDGYPESADEINATDFISIKLANEYADAYGCIVGIYVVELTFEVTEKIL